PAERAPTTPPTATSAASASTTSRVFTGSLQRRNVVEAGPQIPARDGSIRTPRLADSREPFGGWRLSKSVGAFHGIDDPEIAHRQDVGPLKPEDEEHLRRPAADPLHLRERRHDVVVRQRVERLQPQRSVADVRTQVADVSQLLAAQADGTETLVG